jgi:hypothetical protein
MMEMVSEIMRSYIMIMIKKTKNSHSVKKSIQSKKKEAKNKIKVRV